ncbi:MAG: hypothetical protein WAQ25_02470 [Candidatus Saccharimonas sp.]
MEQLSPEAQCLCRAVRALKVATLQHGERSPVTQRLLVRAIAANRRWLNTFSQEPIDT